RWEGPCSWLSARSCPSPVDNVPTPLVGWTEIDRSRAERLCGPVQLALELCPKICLREAQPLADGRCRRPCAAAWPYSFILRGPPCTGRSEKPPSACR